jgi:DNA transformation protein and related proteins
MVSGEYREFVLEQLGRVTPVTWRAMFGGVGIYADGLFFALIDNDLVYFKVDDSNRADFEAAGMRAFQPFGEDSKPMRYYQLPGDLMEDPESLREWVMKAIEVARSARRKGRKGRR